MSPAYCLVHQTHGSFSGTSSHLRQGLSAEPVKEKIVINSCTRSASGLCPLFLVGDWPALTQMDASSHHVTDQEWDFVDGPGGESCGSFEPGLDLTAQKDDTHLPASVSRFSKNPTKTDSKHSQDFLVHHFFPPVASFDMPSNLTDEQIEEAEEAELNQARAKSTAWIFGGIYKNDEHEASSRPADTAPKKFAEEARQKLRAESLGWIFGDVHMNNAHRRWDRLSPAAKEELKANMPGGQQFSDEQVGWRRG